MKRMELEITLTFIIMSIVGIIINGFYFGIAMNSNFLNFDAIAYGIAMALVYLVCIWIFTRRHQWLALLGFLSFCLMLMLIAFSSGGVAIFSNYSNWYYICLFIYFIITCQIAKYHGQKLLEEDEKNLRRTQK